MPRVTFLPSGASGEFPFKTDLLTAARALGVFVQTSCLGEGRCHECLIRVVSGEDRLSPILEDEIGSIPARGLRLACRAKLKGDVVVRVPDYPPPAAGTPPGEPPQPG